MGHKAGFQLTCGVEQERRVEAAQSEKVGPDHLKIGKQIK